MQKTKINNTTALATVVIATAIVLIGGLVVTVTQQAAFAAQPNGKKVVICHKHELDVGGETIIVNEDAVAAHIEHGDNIGPCVPP